jgi:hypothetical protein
MPSSILSQKSVTSSFSSYGEATPRRKNLSSIQKNMPSSKPLTPLPSQRIGDFSVAVILAKQIPSSESIG